MGFEPVRPIPVEMSTQTDYNPTFNEIELERLRKLDEKRKENNEKRRERRKAEKETMDSFEYKSA